MHKFRQMWLRGVKISTKFEFLRKSVHFLELPRSWVGGGSEADGSSLSEYPSCGDAPNFLAKTPHPTSYFDSCFMEFRALTSMNEC